MSLASSGLKGTEALIGLATAGAIGWNGINGMSLGNPFHLVTGALELTDASVDTATGKKGTILSGLGNLLGAGLAAKILTHIKGAKGMGPYGKYAILGLLAWQGYQLAGEVFTPDRTGIKDTLDIGGNIVSISMLLGALGTKNFTHVFKLFARRGKLIEKIAKHTNSKGIVDTSVKSVGTAQANLARVDKRLVDIFKNLFQPMANIIKPVKKGMKFAMDS